MPINSTLIINRAEWLTPDNPRARGIGSYLYERERKLKCCLGFESLACGLTIEQICGYNYPHAVYPQPNIKSFQHLLDSQLNTRLAAVNDEPNIRPGLRERIIQELFKEFWNIDVIFEGSFPTNGAL